MLDVGSVEAIPGRRDETIGGVGSGPCNTSLTPVSRRSS